MLIAEIIRQGLRSGTTWRRVFAVALVIVAAGLSIFRVLRHEKDMSTQFFSDALTPVKTAQNVVIDHRGYLVNRGVVSPNDNNYQLALKVAYAATVASRAPFLSLPQINLVDYDSAVEELDKTQKRFASLQKTNKDSTLVGSALYPTFFLRKLSEAEKTRRQFLESRTENNMYLFIAKEEEAVLAYRQSLKKFLYAFSELIPQTSKKYALVDVIISRDSVLAGLNTMITRVGLIESRLRNFRFCLNGQTEKCSDVVLRSKTLKLEESSKLSLSSFNLASDIRRMLYDASDNHKILEGPLIAITNVSCSISNNDTALFVFWNKKSSSKDRRFDLPLFVSNLRFILSKEHSYDPFSRYFAENGVNFILSNPFEHYRCLQGRKDFSRIFFTREVSTFSEKSPVSRYATGTARNSLLALERLLHGYNSVIRESDAILYISLAQKLAEEVTLPKHETNLIESIALAEKVRSHGLTEEVLRVAAIENHNINLRNIGINIDFGASRLFLTESAFFSLFLADQILDPKEIYDVFQKNNIPEEQQPFVFYTDLSKSSLTASSLKSDMAYYLRLHPY